MGVGGDIYMHARRKCLKNLVHLNLTFDDKRKGIPIFLLVGDDAKEFRAVKGAQSRRAAPAFKNDEN